MYNFFIALVLVFGLTGCITMPDGNSKPDYAMIEFSAVASMTVIVNETKISDEKLVATYNRLQAVHNTLTCETNCPPFDLFMMEQMITESLPIEYQALGKSGIKLIRSRANLYMDVKLPETENVQLAKDIAASVVLGMISALEPKVHLIRGLP
tara:strand:- start:5130 stop:5588 length:459 start_codon:yes stop_codon:yes gene_type:complete